MHVVIAVLTALGGALWAAYYFLGAAREGREAISDVKGLWRSGKWSKKVSARLVENVEDPREAAAILLYQTASYDGAVTERQIAAMTSAMRRTFQADEETAAGLYAFARMAVGQVEDAGNALRKLLGPVIAACTEAERRELVGMLRDIAIIEGPANDKQTRLIDDVERRLFPK